MDTANLSSLLSGVMGNPEVMGKLQGILSDPEAMNSIRNAVSGIGSAQSNTNEAKKDTPPLSLPTLSGQSEEARNRARLISALKPYLNEERRDKAEKLLSLLTLLEVSGSFGNLKL